MDLFLHFMKSSKSAGMTELPFMSSLPYTRCSRPGENLLHSSMLEQEKEGKTEIIAEGKWQKILRMAHT